MNNIAISPSIAMYALQNQNVERKIAKNIDLKRSDTETNDNTKTKDNTETIDISNIDINAATTNINETTDISDISIPSILIPHDQLLNENENSSFSSL